MEDNIEKLDTVSRAGDTEAKKAAITRQAMSMELTPTATEIQIDLTKATKLSLGDLASLGTAFSALPKAFRDAAQEEGLSGKTLYRVVDQFGNSLNADVLQAFNDGSGLLGSFRDAAGNFHQARLKPEMPDIAGSATAMPFDPMTLFVAAALGEINRRLDTILETQQEMFEYIKNRDKAQLRANLKSLTEIFNQFKYYWDDRDSVNTKLGFVQLVKRDADQAIIHHTAEIKGKLNKKGFVHLDRDVRDKSRAVRSELEEYRLSVYLYAFSSFLDVMLKGNFAENYLKDVVTEIETRSIGYRELYTQAYDLIERDADSSVRAMALGGLSGAVGFLGKAIEKTPVGDRTQIDEVLSGASKGLGDLNKDMKNNMMVKLVDASNSDVRPFIDNIENVNRLYNEPVMLMADQDAIYVLPADAVHMEGSDTLKGGMDITTNELR